MHDTPELGWVEFKTSKLLSEYIESHGFKVTRQAYGTETGFEAVFQHGQGGRTIGFNSEMDALPGFDTPSGAAQACGHNLIASASLRLLRSYRLSLTSDRPIAQSPALEEL
jgi:metal-dependent amidase/aminoacylase/carboxypeptidase family protein